VHKSIDFVLNLLQFVAINLNFAVLILNVMEDIELKHIPIKFLAEDDRPREKLVTIGRQNLSDAELLAIILGSGSRTETAVQLAQRILSDHGNDLNQIAKANINELKKFKGVGEAKAINIAATFELGRRRKEADAREKPKIATSYDAFRLLNTKLSDLPHEEFWILLLNRANSVVRMDCISKGGVSGTVVDARLILKPAIETLASGIILCHNHPSGQLKPSEQDLSLTKKLKESARLMDINLLDHIIVGDQKYYSFADEGIL
jgi:DNA repair protein RadC